jgi:hypothetical protein
MGKSIRGNDGARIHAAQEVLEVRTGTQCVIRRQQIAEGLCPLVDVLIGALPCGNLYDQGPGFPGASYHESPPP